MLCFLYPDYSIIVSLQDYRCVAQPLCYTETRKELLNAIRSVSPAMPTEQITSIKDTRAEQAILTGFSEDEKAQFRAYLQRIQNNCANIIHKESL